MTDNIAPDFVCPICGCREARSVMTLRSQTTADLTAFPLVRCVSCGLLRLHPQPGDATLSAAYGNDYAPHRRSGISGKAKSLLEQRSVRTMQAYFAAPRRVLDVGCATGDLLRAIRDAGNPDVVGVEIGAIAADIARQYGLDVREAELEDAAFPDASFDTVVLSHTLEHVGDPQATLREVERILRPGGALILWLPNVESLEARVLGKHWIGYDPPRHLTMFGVSTLGVALWNAHLRLQQVRHEAVGLEWAWALRYAAREYLPAAERVLASLHPALIVAGSALSAVSALKQQSGRVRVIATKPDVGS